MAHQVIRQAPSPGAARVPVGHALANTRLLVTAPGGEPQPIGIPGELCVGGAGVGRGYLGDPERTAEVFRPDPWGRGAGERLYHTGDLALRRPSGEIDYLGRLDHQVKVRGVRIELGEVEAALGAHPAVRDAAVVVRQDLPGGAGLVAFLVLRDGMAPASGELLAWSRSRLPEAMVPVLFASLDALPLTPNGKLDRRALGRLELATGRGALAAGYVAPRTLIELRLCRLWEELMGISPIGVRDGFFALGGSSLTAVRLQARVERAFGWRFELPALFRTPTVEGLAGLLRQRTPPASSCLVRLGGDGAGRPVFWLHPAGGEVLCYADLVRRLEANADRPHYGLRARGFGAGEAPREALAAMAAAYLEEVRAVDADGPYFLGGWSLGGVVAFEMARQLRAAGREVALVALLDTQAPDPARGAGLSDWDLLGAFAQGLGLRDRLTVRGEEELRERGLDAQLAGLLEQARAAGVLPPDLEPADIGRIFAVHRGNSRALRGYAPAPYAGRVVLFRAAERGDRNALSRGGDGLAAGLEVHEVPGDHLTLVREPDVQGLAARLRDCLDARLDPTGA